MGAVKTEPSSSRLFIKILSALSTNSNGKSQIESDPRCLRKRCRSIERITSLLLKCNELATSLSDTNQRLGELEEELQFEVEKNALATNADTQAPETKGLKAAKDCLLSIISEQERANEPDKKRMKARKYLFRATAALCWRDR